ncbi:hypothetical protein BXZ70DRAFT_327277 [Cristinia sonorae]|uniref:Uncharacterized protein n=1 Tax=Cristinia sonorae TaxID=1940300 RepID=A0A8K0UK19_9AGAR|nr:hypothetical protein BXZ70DRAFT_327277 [Cristinia sonorae]
MNDRNLHPNGKWFIAIHEVQSVYGLAEPLTLQAFVQSGLPKRTTVNSLVDVKQVGAARSWQLRTSSTHTVYPIPIPFSLRETPIERSRRLGLELVSIGNPDTRGPVDHARAIYGPYKNSPVRYPVQTSGITVTQSGGNEKKGGQWRGQRSVHPNEKGLINVEDIREVYGLRKPVPKHVVQLAGIVPRDDKITRAQARKVTKVLNQSRCSEKERELARMVKYDAV